MLTVLPFRRRAEVRLQSNIRENLEDAIRQFDREWRQEQLRKMQRNTVPAGAILLAVVVVIACTLWLLHEFRVL